MSDPNQLFNYIPPTFSQAPIPTIDMTFDDGARTVTVSVPVEASEVVRHIAVDAFFGAIDRLRPAHLADPMDDLPRENRHG